MKRRKRQYGWLMGSCLVLFIGALPAYYLVGVWLALIMCAVAAVLPPIAVFVGNIGDPDDPEDHDVRFGPNKDEPDEPR
ncbi:DUF3099 domain-containing protein [Nocardiopsis mangrovi]|uniref:DUF3099 domain-containing protein n=1 Tax=Nocardiopsis mangrovi TaxID=1179818 RepID=A0ABV9DTW9_9ACTN